MKINRNYALPDTVNDIELSILDHGHAISDAEWIGNVVSPMYSRLYYIIGGDPYALIDGERIPLMSGKCYLFPTGFSFRHACSTSMEQLFFHINLNDFHGTDLLRSAGTVMEYEVGGDFIDELLTLTFSSDTADSLKLKQHIGDSILTLINNYGVKLNVPHYSRCVLLAMEYIRSHLSLRISVSELAANAYVSESTLTKKFKAEVGMTVGAYIDETVLFEAEQLLLKSDLTVLQISERFGFCDQFYFSRRFKKKYGETPQKYRKLMLI